LADVEIEEHPKDKLSYWLKWLAASKKAAKRHWRDVDAAEREYNKDYDNDEGKALEDRETNSVYPAYWSACKTLEPALYARTPVITSRRRFGINDNLALIACKIVERLGEYLAEMSDVDAVMRAARADFIHGDKATTQVVLEECPGEKQRIDLQLITTPEGATIYADQSGNPYEGDIIQDEQGYFYEQEAPPQKKVLILALPYDDILHTPDAKSEHEIREKAYRFCMSYHEAVARFGEKAKAWVYTNSKHYDREDHEKDRNDLPGRYLEGWEIWCKCTRKVYWVSESNPQEFLDIKDDPYKLKDFFPSPKFIISSEPTKNLYPTPAYVHLYPTIQQMHRAYDRIFGLLDGARRRALVDGSVPELFELANEASDREFIAVQNLQALIEKGGLENLVQYLPVGELTQAIQELLKGYSKRCMMSGSECLKSCGVLPIRRKLKGRTKLNQQQRTIGSRITGL
jgi:hypothetical protein